MWTDRYPTSKAPRRFYANGEYVTAECELKTMQFGDTTHHAVEIDGSLHTPPMFADELEFAPVSLEDYGLQYGVTTPVGDREDLPTEDELAGMARELAKRVGHTSVRDMLGTEDAAECAMHLLSDSYVLAYCLQENEFTVEAAERALRGLLRKRGQENQDMLDGVLETFGEMGVGSIDFGDGTVLKTTK
jgi:hypothetical protein